MASQNPLSGNYLVKYLGGHPALAQARDGSLWTDQRGIWFGEIGWSSKAALCGIGWNNITAITVEPEKSVKVLSSVVKGVVFLPWGIISAIAGNKKHFLRIGFKDQTGFETDAVFCCDKAQEVRAALVAARQFHLSRRPASTQSPTVPPPTDGVDAGIGVFSGATDADIAKVKAENQLTTTLAGLILLALAFAGLWLYGRIVNPDLSSLEGREVYVYTTGARYKLAYDDDEGPLYPLAITSSDIERLESRWRADSRCEWQDLISLGFVIQIREGTKVHVDEWERGKWLKVSVMEGSEDGQNGYIHKDFISKKPPH